MTDKLLSDEELELEIDKVLINNLQNNGFNADYIARTIDSVHKLRSLFNTQKRLYAESELEKFKANNHIGYAYEVGEVTENYIVLERVVKKGKNWVLRVQCRWCGNEMNRMTNKFNMKHIDCKEWGVHMRLHAEQRARIK